MLATQARVAVAARRYRAGNHALAFFVADHRGSQLLDDADWLVADRQPFGHGAFAPKDMNVGSADRGGGYPQEGIERSDVGDRFGFEDDPPRFDEHGGFHLRHGKAPLQDLLQPTSHDGTPP